MSEHTKGRLKAVGDDLMLEKGRYRMVHGVTACGSAKGMMDERSVRPANARRLAACWNACEGFETDSLENILMLGDTMRSRFAALKAECDQAHRELTAARALLREVITNTQAFGSALECDHGFDGEEWATRVCNYIDACDTLEGNPDAS